MTQLKKQEKLALKTNQTPLRMIKERAEECRDEQAPYYGANQRESIRRQSDLERQAQELGQLKQENDRLQGRNKDLLVSRPEMVLYYAALFLSINVIFGWMTYLALYI
ncbi:MAG: hypothetical protein ACI9TY_000926 [Alphaproteobacteria bacterium]|jgi:hypothetical protein